MFVQDFLLPAARKTLTGHVFGQTFVSKLVSVVCFFSESSLQHILRAPAVQKPVFEDGCVLMRRMFFSAGNLKNIGPALTQVHVCASFGSHGSHIFADVGALGAECPLLEKSNGV